MGSSSGVFLSDPNAKTLTLLHSSSFRLRIYFLYCVQARSSGKDLFYLTTYSTHFNMVFIIIIFICHLTPDMYDVVNCKGLIHQEKVKHTVERGREMFYLTTHSTHFIYGYMVSDIWLKTILIVRKEIHCRHIGYYYQLTARVLLYAPSHRQDNTYLFYTSRGALAETRKHTVEVFIPNIQNSCHAFCWGFS